jgi:hypothetical protein
MIECPYFVRRSFLSTLLLIDRKVHGSKSHPSFSSLSKASWPGAGLIHLEESSECPSLPFSTGFFFNQAHTTQLSVMNPVQGFHVALACQFA